MSGIPKTELLYLLGGFNVRVGADFKSWPTPIGHHGIGRMNDNGQRLLELCTYHSVCVTNTFFSKQNMPHASWRHPRSQHWHQLDIVLTRQKSLNTMHNIEAYHSADCDTDHAVIISKVEFHPIKLHHSKPPCQPKINIERAHDPTAYEEYRVLLLHFLPTVAEDTSKKRWKSLRKVIFDSAMQTYGKKVSSNADWFETHVTKILKVIQVKRQALVFYKRNPTTANHNALKSAKKRCPANCPLLCQQMLVATCKQHPNSC